MNEETCPHVGNPSSVSAKSPSALCEYVKVEILFITFLFDYKMINIYQVFSSSQCSDGFCMVSFENPAFVKQLAVVPGFT